MKFRHLLTAAMLALAWAGGAHAEGGSVEAPARSHHRALSAKAKAKAAKAAAATAPTGLPTIQPVNTATPGGSPVAYDDLPPAARAGLLAYYRSVSGDDGACSGVSLGGFLLGIAPIIKTEYNRDGEPDFLFNAPCAQPGWRTDAASEDALGPPQKILLSDPFGYHVSPQFAASLGRVQSRTVLLTVVNCPEATAGPSGALAGRCYAGRFWDPAKGLWGEIEPVLAGAPIKMAGGG